MMAPPASPPHHSPFGRSHSPFATSSPRFVNADAASCASTRHGDANAVSEASPSTAVHIPTARLACVPSEMFTSQEPAAEQQPSVCGGSPTAGEICPVCLEALKASESLELCTLQPCGHEFHTACMDKFFQTCFVRDCPLCRGEIQYLLHADGRMRPASELKDQFKSDSYDVRFRSGAYHVPYSGPDGEMLGEIWSFFHLSEQVRVLRLTRCLDADGDPRYRAGDPVYRVVVPHIILELVDSNGHHQQSQERPYCVSIVHSQQHGGVQITPDTVVMEDGLARFENLTIECCQPGIVAMKFMVLAPGQLVHNKAVYAAVDLVRGEPSFCSHPRVWSAVAASLLMIITVVLLHYSGAVDFS